MLPPLPPGDWKQGHIASDPATQRPHFARVTNTSLPGITSVWHPLQIDYLELRMGAKLRSHVYETTCPRFPSPVVAKFARFPWETPQLEAETVAYQWIEQHPISPRFLGHIHEEGRIIGFLLERIADYRHATPQDLARCQLTLSKLHKLGIRHGDINKHNFLIHNGQATLIDFDHATRNNDAKTLDEEFRTLQEELQDSSGRGGRTVESSVA